ncbi:HET-domain-containing protein [Stipitochalara longipes BDJ]|nr:HET-domain-containing protein [Stipitochalara longipes BDJ]
MEHEDTLGKAAQNESLAELCPTCHEMLNPPTKPEIYHFRQSQKQTFEDFQEAVSQKCTICSLIWNLTDEHSFAWSQMSPGSWKPVAYAYGEMVMTVVYVDPIKGQNISLDFKFIEPYEQRYNVPSLSNAGLSTSSALDLAHQWFTTCTNTSPHVQCNRLHYRKPKWHPTRLIDIGEQGAMDWTLRVISQDGISDSDAPYMTLSYRWGHDPTLLLLRSNIDKLRAGSPICDLPPTFRDFIAVARRFSVRHVWIDALCIIQDSMEDWELEAPTMRYVYANSVCNVAALASRDPGGGLFRERDPETLKPAHVSTSLFSDKPQSYYMFDCNRWRHEVQKGPLHKRGWVYQERLLAPRVLYFGSKEVFWECFTTTNSEFEALSNIISATKSTKVRRFDDSERNSGVKSGQMSHELVELWMEQVQEYSGCIFTKPSDKLIAFSGIAKLFQHSTNDVYIAGMWKSRLVDTMDWYVKEPKPLPPATRRTPSWSWVSLDSPVVKRLYEGEYEVEILDLQFTTVSDPTVGVTDAYVKLRAKIFSASVQHINPPRGDAMLTFRRKVICMIFKALYLSGNSEGHEDNMELEQTAAFLSFLILEQVGSDLPVRYQRIGYMDVLNYNDIETLLPRGSVADITIV